MDRPPSIREIAARLNLSTATVSLALNGHPRIPDQTANRVREMARDLGYRPNQLVARLAANRWRPSQGEAATTLAFVYVDHLRRTRLHPWTRMVAGAREEAESLGYRIEVHNLVDHGKARVLDRILRHRGVEGLILGRAFDASPILQFSWSQFSTIACGASVYPMPVHGVTARHFSLVQRAWSELHQRGYRRIGCVLFDLKVPLTDDLERLGAFLALSVGQEAGDRIPPLVQVIPNAHELVRWYERFLPEAVIGMNSWVWASLVEQIPGLQSHCGFAALHVMPGEMVSGLHDLETPLGRTAVRMLAAQLRQHQRGTVKLPMWHELEPEWVDQGTCPARAKKRPGRRSGP